MKQYLDLIDNILENGTDVDSRAGKCRLLTHQTMSFNMCDGFPRLTNRYVPFKSVAVELEGFIGGVTSKKWYQDRGCKFWDEWANPQIVKEKVKEYWDNVDVDPEFWGIMQQPDKRIQKEVDDLGPIYGWQWRRQGQDYVGVNKVKLLPKRAYKSSHNDQLQQVLATLTNNPYDRRMRVSSVSLCQEHEMALPACHDYWKVDKIGEQLDLFFHMRSWDVYLGGPANIQSYAILLHLLAKHANLKPGKLTVFASNAHLYENTWEQSKELLTRPEFPLPQVEFNHDDFWDWNYTKVECLNYKHSGKLTAEVAV